MGDGEWASLDNVTLASSDTHTVTATLDPVEIGDKGTLRLDLDVSARSGTTPTLDVTLQTSKSNAGPWRTLGTFTQATAVGTERKSFAGCDRWARAVLTIGGTDPSFTVGISGEAV